MWFVDLLTRPSAIQAVIVLSAVCALGLSLAKFRFRGISLGITSCSLPAFWPVPWV